MCQLTLVASKGAKLTQLLILNQLDVNASSGHKDGWGIFVPAVGTKKSGSDFSKLMNSPDIIRGIVTDNSLPIMGHVRIATASVGGKREVSEENSHPFETENFILSHNGILSTISEEDEKKFTGKVDSYAFVLALEEEYAKEKDFPKALNNAMKRFNGKFAFLIFNKAEKNYYVVRGNATLYFSKISVDGSPAGFVINTEKDPLLESIYRTKFAMEIFTGKPFDFTTPELLKAETIFLVKGFELEIVGEIKETHKSYSYNYSDNRTYYGRGGSSTENFTNGGKNYTQNNSSSGGDYHSLIEKLFRLSDENELTVWDLDLICYRAMKMPLAYLEMDDVKYLVERVLPKLAKFNNQSKKKLWKAIMEYVDHPKDIYMTFDIQYPYMLNSAKFLMNILMDLKKEE